MPAKPLPLPELIDRHKAEQNGHGWDDFYKAVTSPVRPSANSLARLYNRNIRTIQYWFARYDREYR